MEEQIIFILDDEPAITDLLARVIDRVFPSAITQTFATYGALKAHPLLSKVSLFIYDIGLNGKLTGDAVAREVAKVNQAPVLFISGLGYNLESFIDSMPQTVTYDFIAKPVDTTILTNRVKVLLKVSKTYECFQEEQALLKLSLKEVFDYSNLYLLILDEEMVVKSCSYKLMEDMGYDDICDIEGQSWLNFIPGVDKATILRLHGALVANANTVEKGSLEEAVTTVQRKDGTILDIRWFYSLLVNGHVHSFNIGIPHTPEKFNTDSIEAIRKYWKQSIKENNAALKAIKSTLDRNPNKNRRYDDDEHRMEERI